ncbi:MAG: triose-phosphate isomerase [Firmicutes bacterium]|nr:triose-phosphate isomerase [Bacillota bacterium]MCL2255767.1 triose-phosphate isomerase [Bacillota bacterium]
MKRNRVIAGNWKMNMTQEGAKALMQDVIKWMPKNLPSDVDVVVCVPFTLLNFVNDMIKGTRIKLGAQNMSWAEKGAFTGEISASQLIETGVSHVIIGHSERREMFNETCETVNKKIKYALANNLTPIFCIGESLEQFEKGETNATVARQVKDGLNGLTEDELTKVVVAYEPIWAIGTGKTASPQDAQNTIAFIRAELLKNVAEQMPILYGGSMNAENAKDLLSQNDIDGGLIGGASLKAHDFLCIAGSTI